MRSNGGRGLWPEADYGDHVYGLIKVGPPLVQPRPPLTLSTHWRHRRWAFNNNLSSGWLAGWLTVLVPLGRCWSIGGSSGPLRVTIYILLSCIHRLGSLANVVLSFEDALNHQHSAIRIKANIAPPLRFIAQSHCTCTMRLIISWHAHYSTYMAGPLITAHSHWMAHTLL